MKQQADDGDQDDARPYGAGMPVGAGGVLPENSECQGVKNQGRPAEKGQHTDSLSSMLHTSIVDSLARLNEHIEISKLFF